MLYAIAVLCVVAAFSAGGEWETVGCLALAGIFAAVEVWMDHRYG